MDARKPVYITRELSKVIQLERYCFPHVDESKGIKKSRHRKMVQAFLNAARNRYERQVTHSDSVNYSRAYCGNEVIQMYSTRYEVGCDIEDTQKFFNVIPFFTSASELTAMQKEVGKLERNILLCIIWACKESVAKLLNIPLREFLAERMLCEGEDGWCVKMIGQPIQIYIEVNKTKVIAIAYCERE